MGKDHFEGVEIDTSASVLPKLNESTVKLPRVHYHVGFKEYAAKVTYKHVANAL